MGVVGETILSTFLEGLVDRLLSPEFMSFVRGGELNEILEKLKLTMSIVAAVVNDAEEKQFEKPNVKAWVNRLRHVVYDAEDVLDEIATKALEEQLQPEPVNAKVWNIVYKCRKIISGSLRQFNQQTESKLKKIFETLQYLLKQKDVLGLKDTAGESSFRDVKRLETTSLLNEPRVFGRDHDKEKIIEVLLSDEADSVNGVCVVPIVGMGGIGKTTLAQVVYNDGRVKEHFDFRAWVCVSDQFDVKKVTKTTLESISQETCFSYDLNNLQVNLEKKVMGKKFLLVLDDVWNDDYNQWVALRKPFRTGAPGSKILLTTRNRSVSSIMRTVPDYSLEQLSDDDCWSLFKQHAFPDCCNVNPKLEAIGREIVKKCRGLPLATSTLGGLLRSRSTVSKWDEVLNSRMWNLSDDSGILPALRLSYHHLPLALKRCFVYFSIFPKEYEFTEEELVLLWIAEGFVPQLKGMRMEDLGRKYFNDLLSRSLLQQSCSNKSTFVMHNLIHNLARSVSEGACLRLEDMTGADCQYNLPRNIHHWSYIRDYYEAFSKFQEAWSAEISLRTFLPLDGGRKFSYLPDKVLLELFQKSNYLRVLSLNSYQINDLPESIGKLRHLRYLDLSHTSIRRLPESTSTLYNLQTLLVIGCHSLTELFSDIGSLVNLRHLNMTQSNLRKMPLGIGRLNNLQTLSNFVVGKNNRPGIRELKNLSNLRGSLTILGLENVVDVKEFIEAKFENKQYLTALVLEWSKDVNVTCNENSTEQMLDIILSRTRLKDLTISYYKGKTFPTPRYHYLETLVLSNMLQWVEWSSESEIFCSLRRLEIRGCPKLRKISHRFAVLEKLTIECCQEFVVLSSFSSSGKAQGETSFFPCLRELLIEHCPKLVRLPNCLPSLVQLKIIGCVELNELCAKQANEMPCVRELSIWNCPKIRKLPAYFPLLVQLHLRGCTQLTALPRSPLICKLRLEDCNEVVLRSAVGLLSLTCMRLCKIQKLRCLPEGLIRQLEALEDLEILSCEDFVALSNQINFQHLTSLHRLVIFNCPQLEELPSQLHSLTALNKLEIWACPRLRASADVRLPSKLRDLWISSEAESLPVRMMHTMSLERLSVWNSPSLRFFPNCKLSSSLKALAIMTCSKLELLPEQMLHQNNSLESLLIESCESLHSLGIRAFTASTLSNLKELKIIGCGNLKCFPEGLHNLASLCSLIVISCPHLVSFPDGGFPAANLRKIQISKCYELKSLPVHNVLSLNELTIRKCPNLICFPEGTLPDRLERLIIDGCGNLEEMSKWGFERLVSLKSLSIAGGYAGQVYFTEGLLPSSLTSLWIKNLPKLEFIGKALQHLSSLKYLRIIRCRRLSALPEEWLPVSLSFLQIVDCPRVKELYEVKKRNGIQQYSHISCLRWDADF